MADESSRVRGIVFTVCVCIVGLTLAGFYVRRAMPSCDDPLLMHQLTEQISLDDHHRNGMLVTNVSTISGRFFGQRSCRALVTEIRNDVDLSAGDWTRITYTSPISDPHYVIGGLEKPPIKNP